VQEEPKDLIAGLVAPHARSNLVDDAA
jgi:hypothetical protein